MAEDMNRWNGTGNLTQDPKLREFPSGHKVCNMRIACNGRVKNRATGQWEDEPNFFDVSVWGAQGENCARWLSKGKGVAIDGRLRWRQWEHEGVKHQGVEIVAELVRFTGGGDGQRPGGNGVAETPPPYGEPDISADVSDFLAAGQQGYAQGGAGTADDDIPF